MPDFVGTRSSTGLFVTSLPGSPKDGQEVYFLAEATTGTVWHLRYRAASASAYKWEYLGGPPLVTETDLDQGTASGAFVNLATVMGIVIPLAGEYDVQWHATVYRLTANGACIIACIRSGGAQVGRVDCTGLTTYGIHWSNRARAAFTAETVNMQFAAGGGGTSQFSNRKMAITPVRVG